MRQFIDVKTLDQTLSSYIITEITMRLESFIMKWYHDQGSARQRQRQRQKDNDNQSSVVVPTPDHDKLNKLRSDF